MLAKIIDVAVGQPWRHILVLAIDGADVPTRPATGKGRGPGRKEGRAKRARWRGEWREAKGFRFYLLADGRSGQVLSWHQVQTDEEAAAALRQVKAAGLIPAAEVRLCVMADGAPWIWKQAHALFPTAVGSFGLFPRRGRPPQGAGLANWGTPPAGKGRGAGGP